MRTFLRRALAVIAVLLIPVAGGAISAFATFDAQYAPGPDRPVPAATSPAFDPAKPTAVVVIGDNGAVVSDALAPYEILVASGRFNVYTVASRRRPLPLTGGLDLVPDLSFADLAELTGGAAPTLAVIPAIPDVGEPSTGPVTTWLRDQVSRGTLLLSVCNGAGVLASAGLLDGRPATAHWMRIGSFESDYPAVNWVHGKRFVDSGTVVTTAGVLSGIDGTLHMIERLAGSTVAANAAKAVGWRYYGNTPPVVTGIAMPAPAAIVNAGWTWAPPTVGVMLTPGVGEIDLASVFETHDKSLADRTLAVSADGGPIRSRHGLTFLPRADLAGAAPDLDRLLVPGAGVRLGQVPDGLEPVYVHSGQDFAYNDAVRDLARTTDVATARWTAETMELPTDGLRLDGPAWPWQQTALPILLILLGIAAVICLPRLRTAVDTPVRA
ncbi:DJ-1/PfpI family protein [Streptosporangium sp. 'caverna']|uniref:DJ-1/PfpI family protein n=1 Tax=Streptosporangium sp. 'caverna' TaxID=2202249 RepID=UPI000D7E0516|nr:DJ-1/PfpI family protein [Streptosporangium sp. 'caverna']AWS46912.1 AraC family transcriptional regulator [Streptosporangium sp. 'caverna']